MNEYRVIATMLILTLPTGVVIGLSLRFLFGGPTG